MEGGRARMKRRWGLSRAGSTAPGAAPLLLPEGDGSSSMSASKGEGGVALRVSAAPNAGTASWRAEMGEDRTGNGVPPEAAERTGRWLMPTLGSVTGSCGNVGMLP